MKICLVCNEFPPYSCGGIGIFSNELANALISKGHEVIAIGVYSDTEEDVTLDNGLRIIRIKSWGGRSAVLTNSMRLGQKIKKLIKSNQVDIVELPDFEGLAAFWTNMNVPVVTRLHGSVTYFAKEMNTPQSKATTLIEKRSLNNSKYICSVSQYTADKTKDIFGLNKEIHIIYNGVKIPDEQRCKKTYEDTHIVSFSGSLMRKKGVLSLAKAWNIVKKEFPDAQLKLIGKDTMEDGISIKQKIYDIVEQKHHNSLEFTGHIDKSKMEDILVSSDLAIYPSYAEAFSLAPLEAMALGLPVIYSKRTSGLELGDIISSLSLINPDDTKEIAQTICKLLINKNLREQIGKENRLGIIKHFNTDEKIDENIRYYEECING